MNDIVKIETVESATLILLNRPAKHNALSPALLHDLTIAISDAPSSKPLIIGSTSEIFCSGLDIDDLGSLWTEQSKLEDYFEMLHSLYRAIYAHPALTMAFVRKGAFGGGFGLACCCDRILARRDSRFVLPGEQFGNLARLARPPIMTKFPLIKLEDVSAIEISGESGPIFEICDDSVLTPPFPNCEAFFTTKQSELERRLSKSSQTNFAKTCNQIKTMVLNDLGVCVDN